MPTPVEVHGEVLISAHLCKCGLVQCTEGALLVPNEKNEQNTSLMVTMAILGHVKFYAELCETVSKIQVVLKIYLK